MIIRTVLSALYLCMYPVCVYVSRKKQSIPPTSPISINGCPLETTPTFKYLGIILSSDLSWSNHINNTCSKAKQILGLIYRRFYRHSNKQTLRQLYLSLVRPHLEYAACVWSPHLQKDIDTLEKTQLFASKICTKTWDSSYYELLTKLHLPSLAQLRLHMNLCLMYKIVHGLMYFPPGLVVPNINLTHSTHSILTLIHSRLLIMSLRAT
jgi:hypothetical protein